MQWSGLTNHRDCQYVAGCELLEEIPVAVHKSWCGVNKKTAGKLGLATEEFKKWLTYVLDTMYILASFALCGGVLSPITSRNCIQDSCFHAIAVVH